jgi:hypothetical protein
MQTLQIMLSEPLQQFVLGQVAELGLSKDEFMRRAQNYTPSDAFRNILKKMGQRLPDKLSGGKPVDIIAWFQESLKSGLTNREVKTISLAGEGCYKKPRP